MGTSGIPLQYVIVCRLGAFFLKPNIFDNSVPFDNTTPIYLINLLSKFLGLVVDLHYFSIFHRENENEHLTFRKFYGR